MILYLRTMLRSIVKNERGASAIEYALLVAAIAAVIVGVVFAFGNQIKGMFTNTCSAVQNNGNAGNPPTC